MLSTCMPPEGCAQYLTFAGMQEWAAESSTHVRSLLNVCQDRTVRAHSVAARLSSSPQDTARALYGIWRGLWPQLQTWPPQHSMLAKVAWTPQLVSKLQTAASIAARLSDAELQSHLPDFNAQPWEPLVSGGKVQPSHHASVCHSLAHCAPTI